MAKIHAVKEVHTWDPKGKQSEPAWTKDRNADLRDKYRRSDPQRRVSTCLDFVASRFLDCKHLVQSVVKMTTTNDDHQHFHLSDPHLSYSFSALPPPNRSRSRPTVYGHGSPHLILKGSEHLLRFDILTPNSLVTLKRVCRGFMCLYMHRTLVDVEKRFNLARSGPPTTWDPKLDW